MRTGYWMGLLLACAITVHAQVPYSFNYQGVLRGGAGEMLPASPPAKNVELRLYSQATSGTALWGRNYAVLLDTNGLFNVELSDTTGNAVNDPSTVGATLTNVIAGDTPLYLGLTVVGAAEIAPRQQLLSVPFALMAGDVQSASGDFTVNGTIHGNGTIPIGGIILWSGSQANIPAGWALCDGQNLTPDLRNRFVVGAGGDYLANVTGGAMNVTLTANQIPAHTHTYKDGYMLEKLSDANTGYIDGYDNLYSGRRGNGSLDNNNDTVFYRMMTTSNNITGGAPFDNRPPYYSLCYIMRIK